MNEPEPQQGIKRVQSWVEHPPARRSESSAEQVAERVRTLIAAAERASEAIREDAERQADEYLAEAQRRADRLTTARIQLIANLTDDLIGHAGAVRSHSEQMVDSLEQTVKTITEGERIELDPNRAAGLPQGGKGSADSDPDHRDLESGSAPELKSGAVDSERPSSDEQARVAESESGSSSQPANDPLEASGVTAYGGASARAADGGTEAEPEEPSAEGGSDELGQEAATLRATRLGIAGNDRDDIAEVLRAEFGVSDPGPILERVLGPS